MRWSSYARLLTQALLNACLYAHGYQCPSPSMLAVITSNSNEVEPMQNCGACTGEDMSHDHELSVLQHRCQSQFKATRGKRVRHGVHSHVKVPASVLEPRGAGDVASCNVRWPPPGAPRCVAGHMWEPAPGDRGWLPRAAPGTLTKPARDGAATRPHPRPRAQRQPSRAYARYRSSHFFPKDTSAPAANT